MSTPLLNLSYHLLWDFGHKLYSRHTFLTDYLLLHHAMHNEVNEN